MLSAGVAISSQRERAYDLSITIPCVFQFYVPMRCSCGIYYTVCFCLPLNLHCLVYTIYHMFSICTSVVFFSCHCPLIAHLLLWAGIVVLKI